MARILVVDDDLSIALLVRGLLVRDGHEVRVAASAEQALDAYDSRPFDLVITDKMMPGGNGIELIRKLRERDASIPAILMTAYPDLPERDLAIQGYLAKPFAKLDWLREKVATTLQIYSRLKALRAA